MVMPANLPISMSQVAAELGLPLPLSFNHPWVIYLAGKTALPVSMSDFESMQASWTGVQTIGKSFGTPTFWEIPGIDPNTNKAIPLFGDAAVTKGSHVLQMIYNEDGTGQTRLHLTQYIPCNVLVTDNSTGQSAVLTYGGIAPSGYAYQGYPFWWVNGDIGLYNHENQTHSFAFSPHS
jgi:hypothetical protein